MFSVRLMVGHVSSGGGRGQRWRMEGHVSCAGGGRAGHLAGMEEREEREAGASRLLKTDCFSVKRIERVGLTFCGASWSSAISGHVLGVLPSLGITWSLSPAHHRLHEARGAWATSWLCWAVLVLPAWEKHVGSVSWVGIHVEQSASLSNILLISPHSPFALGHQPRAPTSTSPAPLARCCSGDPARLWKLFCEHQRHCGGGGGGGDGVSPRAGVWVVVWSQPASQGNWDLWWVLSSSQVRPDRPHHLTADSLSLSWRSYAAAWSQHCWTSLRLFLSSIKFFVTFRRLY